MELRDHFSTIVDLANLTTVPLRDETTSQGTELCTEGTTLIPLLKKKESRMEQNGCVPLICEKNKMVLSIRNEEYRCTVWLKCNPKTEASDWSNKVFGNELYDLRTDTSENVHLATDSRFNGIQSQLHNQIVAGWRLCV